MFRDADEAAIQDIKKRYGDFILSERLPEVRAHRTVFESREEFRAEFSERLGDKPEEGTLGWTAVFSGSEGIN